MLKDITVGQYYRVDSVIHRMDPRTKVIGTFLFIIELFLVKNLIGFVIAGIMLAVVIHLTKIPFRYIVRGQKSIAFLLLFTIFS